MTPEEHAVAVADEAHRRIMEKYASGQREHGGQLWRKRDIIGMAIDEAVDQVIYLLTLRDQIDDADFVLGDLSD